MHTRKEQMEAFGRFLDILDELRNARGTASRRMRASVPIQSKKLTNCVMP